MKFIVPLKYVYDAESQKADRKFFEQLHRDLGYGDTFIGDEVDGEISSEALLDLLVEHLPEGHYDIIEGTLSISIQEYWEFGLRSVLAYCEEHQIPYDYYVYYDNSDCNCVYFYRPYFEKEKWNVIDDYDKSTVSFDKVNEIVNWNDEDLSDGDVLQKLGHFLEQQDHQSQTNQIRNWI